VRAAFTVRTLEVSAAREAAAPPWLAIVPGHRYGVKRLRPLRLRRFRIARPDRVRILARKPWVRARLRFFG
jgi:hypothetical protein